MLSLYTTAVTAASVLGDHERALDLVSRMSSVGVKPNVKTLTSLIGACLTNDRPDLASEVYKRTEAPDGYAMSQGIQAFCGTGDLASAAKILSTQRRGSRQLSGRALMKGYETIVTTAIQLGDLGMARKMFTELLAKSYIPSKYIHTEPSSKHWVCGTKDSSSWREQGWLSSTFNFFCFSLIRFNAGSLALDPLLYAAVIVCGKQLGGLNREVSLLLIKSKALSGGPSAKVVVLEGEATISEHLVVQWEELVHDRETVDQLTSDAVLLPPLEVSVNKRSSGTILFAEQFVSELSRPTEQQ